MAKKEENAPKKKMNFFVFIFLCIATFGLFYLFYKRSDKKRSPMREWADAILFAVIAATFIRTFFIEAFTIPTSSMEKSLLIGDFLFVSKVSYGPRIPMTPVSFPFAHHTMPFTETVKSYSEIIKIPYYRLPGFGKIKNNDVVVFNYPMEDFRPVDKQENYIKRCVAIPGDKLEIKQGIVYINEKMSDMPEKMQWKYHVQTDGSDFNPRALMEMDITEGAKISNNGDYELSLTKENAEKIKSFGNVIHIEPMFEKPGVFAEYIFPFDSQRKWNVDNYGPITIPKAGESVKIDLSSLPLYKRIIEVYEKNKLEVKDGKIYINDQLANSYTFKMNYYFMMGDNRHNSADSRFWGFVPDDHIVGKAVFVWLSLDNNATSIFNKVRWKRVFVTIGNNKVSSSYLLPVLILGGGIYFYVNYRRKKSGTAKK
ncbi:MAG: signal peptidase I [Bacteroidia bacterium]|nr:signal peptidase I [Bacteroidia bacterium]